jgi:hypothetical protein
MLFYTSDLLTYMIASPLASHFSFLHTGHRSEIGVAQALMNGNVDTEI